MLTTTRDTFTVIAILFLALGMLVLDGDLRISTRLIVAVGATLMLLPAVPGLLIIAFSKPTL